MIGRDTLVMRERHNDVLEGCEPLVIAIHGLCPSLIVGRKLPELHEAERRAHLINPIIEPGGCNIIAKTVATVTIPGKTRHAMRAQQLNALRQSVIIGG